LFTYVRISLGLALLICDLLSEVCTIIMDDSGHDSVVRIL